MTDAEYESEAIRTKDTPYLALAGELWGVFCEDLGENRTRYNGMQSVENIKPSFRRCSVRAWRRFYPINNQ